MTPGARFRPLESGAAGTGSELGPHKAGCKPAPRSRRAPRSPVPPEPDQCRRGPSSTVAAAAASSCGFAGFTRCVKIVRPARRTAARSDR